MSHVMEYFIEVVDLSPQRILQSTVEQIVHVRLADPEPLAATRWGADRRRHCTAEFGGDCRSHHAHSQESHLKSTSDQIVDVPMPRVVEDIIEFVVLLPQQSNQQCTTWVSATSTFHSG